MFQHASEIEFGLVWLAVTIFLLIVWLTRKAWRDMVNVQRARDTGTIEMWSPRASVRSSRHAVRRQVSNLSLSFVFVALTVWAMEVPPPPPLQSLRDQITPGKCFLLIGMLIVGDKANAERRARWQIEQDIEDDDDDRRRTIAAATRFSE